ncbi:MAG: GNAT family N-acetyltransferase [Tenericutes bacterium HGW-Tenericutes-2]|nr:MAG: GNAT family N-acetyltransferase [Tenericutes bacterium HGW-Tenericutes-2]
MIRRYRENDASMLMKLIESEGDEWSSYYQGDGKDKYLVSLKDSITYIMIIDNEIIGYIRAIDDHGFDVYICDLLVHKEKRGNHYGKRLIQVIQSHFIGRDIYVMSDVDGYYIKEGLEKIGSIFKI